MCRGFFSTAPLRYGSHSAFEYVCLVYVHNVLQSLSFKESENPIGRRISNSKRSNRVSPRNSLPIVLIVLFFYECVLNTLYAALDIIAFDVHNYRRYIVTCVCVCLNVCFSICDHCTQTVRVLLLL